MRSPRSRRQAWLVVCLLAALPLAWPPSRAAAQPPTDEDTARQQQIIARFVTVLERNPRRGTALDKIYGFHIENGSIEEFVKQLRERTASKPDDGAGWMILGLVESQRGHDAAAVEALAKAKELRPTDPLAPYYLGQSLVLVGQPEKAAAAFEEAIARKPAQADLLEIFQALGRVHQRAQRTQEALEVWNRLEKLFPGDPRVQEQIAVTLVEEGQSAEALPRYEALANATTDDYRRTTYRMDAAELKIKLNRASEGIADLEQLLAKLNPESWLFREVRRKIEEVFLRTDDQDGLSKYYTAWVEKNSDDVEAMARLARVLARQARVPEAQQWLDKALKLAPSRKDLRVAFIEQLVDDQRYAEAVQQYAELDKAEPNNPDYLRDWGKLTLRDSSRPKEQRQQEAERIWRRLVAARPADPLAATQVADLFRNAEMQGQALELYQKAVELAPDSPQYLEYLGEYYHILKRTDEALATWRKMTEGKQRTAANLLRLAEVLSQFGYLSEALPEIAAACQIDPKDYALALKAADFAIRGDQFDTALDHLTRAEKLAQNDEEREAVLTQQIKTFTLQNRLGDLAADLAKQSAAGNATHHQLFLLARYREALHEYPEATKAINDALAMEPSNIPSLAAAARIAEQAGDLKTSADLNRKLAIVDRRARSEYLERVAGLETQLGRVDEAIAAGKELIAASPGNVETYQFFADLCFRLGRHDEGIAALRRASRVNPNEPALLLSLAAALAGQFRTDEAIELYWQAMEKGKNLDDKLSTIGRLTELYLQTNHFDQLLERLERGRREADQRREMTICLAQAYQSAGDYGMARQELERLLSEHNRDTQLLFQLSKLAESESDLTTAVKYQEQLAKLAPSGETEYRLATLLARAGENQEAAAILVRLAAKEEDREKMLRNIDSLLGSGQEDTALAVIEPKLRENPVDWELLYRQGVALVKRRPADASRPLLALLDLSLSDEELSAAAKARQAMQRRAGSSGSQSMTTVVTTLGTTTTYQSMQSQTGPFARLSVSYELRQALGIDNMNYGFNPTRLIWTPPTFGQARMASLGWLYRLALDANQADDFLAERRKPGESPTASPRELWDWVYLQTIRNDTGEMLAIARRLAEQNDLAGQWLFLQQLVTRNQSLLQQSTRQVEDRNAPLTADELDLMRRSFRAVEQASASHRQGMTYPVAYLQRAVLAELRRAGQKAEEEQIYQEILAKPETTTQITDAMQIAVYRNDVPAFTILLDRFAKKDLQAADTKSTPARSARTSAGNLVGQLVGNGQTSPADALNVLDRYLDYVGAWSNQQRSNPLNRTSSRSSSQSVNYIYAYVGGVRRRANTTFPPANAYFDNNAIAFLRTVFELFKQKDLASDLLKHVEARLVTTAAADKVFASLGLAYLQIWNDEPDAGFKSLSDSVALVPQDLDLRMDIARFYMQNQQLDEALTMVDAVTPLDQRVLEQRETLALDLAVRLGDHERAHHAAERLFGLRLTPETQVQLATQMRRLGMVDEAEAVIARAQRQAGNRLSALSALMTQYQSQGRMEIAVQVAHQILRRSRTQQVSQQLMGVYSQDTQYRTSALQCLSQAGKIKDLIAAVESQLERSPASTQLFETLAEYYQASGDSQKLLDLQAKVIALRPDEPELRFRYAHELQNRGKSSEACDHYLVALKKQPRLMGNDYWEVTNAFQQAKREMDLVKLLNDIDIRAVGQPYVAVNLIQNLRRNKEGREASIELLKKAWAAFPQYRASLMSSFNDSQAWANPQIFEFATQAVIPTPDTARQSPWYGIGDVMYFGGEGKVHTVLLNLLDAGTKNNELPAVRELVAKTASEIKEWRGGPAVLALIDLKLGKRIDPEAAFASLRSQAINDYRLQYARWVVGQELADRPETQPLAVELLKLALSDTGNSIARQFQYGPAQKLVRIYTATGRRSEAEQLLAEWIQSRAGYEFSSDPYYNLGRRAEDLMAIGRFAEEQDFPVEGLRVYRELLTDPAFSDSRVLQFSGRNVDQMRQQAQKGLDSITTKLASDPDGQVTLALLKPVENRTEGSAAIDLMLAAPLAGGAMPKLESTLEKMLKPRALGIAAAGALDEQLSNLAERNPRDVSIRVVQTLVNIDRDPASSGRTVQELEDFLARAPLEELKPGQRANARQRAEAAQRIGVWLIARRCLTRSELREVGRRLTERAVVAARRQVEPAMLAAILYEKGLIAIDDGDRAAGQQTWNELIDLAIVQPRVPRTTASKPAARTGGTPNGSRAAGPIPATLSQFALATALAEAAADKGQVEVSLRAVREVLSGGLPVPDLTQTPISGPGLVRVAPTRTNPNARADLDSTVSSEVATRMWALSMAWRKNQFPPADVCAVLESLVFPASRPGDVLLYEQPIGREWTSPRSVGRVLVEWAMRAERGEQLKGQIAARRATPSDVMSGEVLLVQFHTTLGQRDQASEHLVAIGKLLDGARTAALTAAASHAAGFAFAHAPLTHEAAAILEKISQANAAINRNSVSSNSADPLTRLLVRHAIKQGDLEAAKRHIEQYLTARQSSYGRWGDDYGLYIQRQDLAWATTELARAGDISTSLDMLGRYADAPKHRNGDPPIAAAIWHLVRQAKKLPTAERYELLRDWTLPAKERRSVRVIAGIDVGQPIPEIFLPTGGPSYESEPSHEVTSNLTLLIQAALEAGKIAELKQLVEPLAAEKVSGAESLLTMILIAHGDTAAAPRLADLTETIRARLAKKSAATTDDDPFAAPEQPQPVEWTEVLVFRTALANSQFAASAVKLGELLLDQARKGYRSDVIARLERDLAEQSLRDLSPSEQSSALSPRLAHWFTSAGTAPASTRGQPTLWTAHEGHLLYVTGQWYDQLYFRYPLTGDFEFTFESKSDERFSPPSAAYAGLVASFGADASVHPVANHERANRPPLPVNSDGWNRTSVRFGPGGVRFAVNGHLLYEDTDSSRSSPWLHVQTAVEHRSVLRNVRITGQPIIPREVPLVERDRLEGWLCAGGRLPPRISLKEPRDRQQDYYGVTYDEDGQPIRQQNQTPDWIASAGELTGRLDPAAAQWAGTRLYYHRPLLTGERIRYQFQYRAGLTEVHPSLGKLVFLLEPDGVRLHWVDSDGDDSPLVIEADNRAVDSSTRRGPEQLPLKENDWNDLELAVENEHVQLRLNGELIFERPIEPTNDRRFGLFHFKGQTAAEVREVVLSGDWPHSLPTGNTDLLALAPHAASDAVLHARHALVGEDVLGNEAFAVWQRAMKLPAVERFALLKDWVLPNASHPVLRLHMDWTAIDSVSSTDAAGGILVSPALELVAAAKELGKLDELAAAIALATKEYPDQDRAINAFSVLLALARGEENDAAARLTKAIELVQAQPADAPSHERHGEYLAAYSAREFPAARTAALKLARQLATSNRPDDEKEPPGGSGDWRRRAQRLEAMLLWASDPETRDLAFGSEQRSGQWLPVSRMTANDRGEGFGPAVWKLRPGEASFFTGAGHDALYFHVPLRGNFDVAGRVTSEAKGGIRFVYGGIALGITADGAKLIREEVARTITKHVPLTEKVAGLDQESDFRLSVKEGALTLSINGRQIHKESLPLEPDPWLAIESESGDRQVVVKCLRIEGAPSVPDQISLGRGFGLEGWSASYYGESVGEDVEQPNRRRVQHPMPIWSKQGDEIVVGKLPNCERSFRESVLQYHRPLVEDCEVEYEFFYEPGKMEVHPAIDRVAFLLRADGVQVHRLTNAQYDRTGLASDNATPLDGSQPLALKERDWNKVKLRLAGSDVVLEVNEAQVGRAKLEATNERALGLFRYADAAGVRVRNVIYRGDWPKVVPPPEEQELAQKK
jgi:tetratricopeptide (TPR) repeat protein